VHIFPRTYGVLEIFGQVDRVAYLINVDLVNGTPTNVEGTVVIVDVMRSSTAIVAALRRSARSVIPCKGIEEATNLAHKLGRRNVVLAGERWGIKPRGFDVDISPVDFMRMELKNRVIVYTSTNLTRILARVVELGRNPIIVGGFINAKFAASAALCSALSNKKAITIVACGLDGHPAIEDIIGAGAIASYMHSVHFTDSVLAAISAYHNKSWKQMIMRGMVPTYLRLHHRDHLINDLNMCLELNKFRVVPILKRGRFVRS